jgi:hypothetical protein
LKKIGKGRSSGSVGEVGGAIGEAGLGQLVEPFLFFLKSIKNDTELSLLMISIILYTLQQYLVIVLRRQKVPALVHKLQWNKTTLCKNLFSAHFNQGVYIIR